MSPIESAVVVVLGLLLSGYRLIPNWGRALGETFGIFRSKGEDSIER